MASTATASRPNPRQLFPRIPRHLPSVAAFRGGRAAAVAPFVIQAARADDGTIRVSATGPAGQATASATPPAIDPLPPVVAEGDERPWKLACRTGERLFQTLFQPPIARLYQESLEQAGDDGLPIVLALDDDELRALPWELLRDPERERFLALSTRTPLSRVATTTATTSRERRSVERGNLRVMMLASSVDESALATVARIAADPWVDVTVHERLDPGAHPHVVIVAGEPPAEPIAAPLVVHAGLAATAIHPAVKRGAELAIPASMQPAARQIFAATLAASLAAGDAVDRAVAAARRATADDHGVLALDWAEPVLRAANPSAPLVAPARNVAVETGQEIAVKTASWLRDALTGSLSAVLFLLAGLLVYRLGFSTSNAIELDLLSPFELFTTFKGMILGLSTFEDRLLLLAAAALVALTAVVAGAWYHYRHVDPEEKASLVTRLARPIATTRTLSFLTIAALTVAGAYAYQQYLWRVVLPIPADALGLAVTREAAAASIRQDLADLLDAQGQSGRIVVRDLPVSFDAGDTEKARALGERIGAKAVLIYREIDRGVAGKQYAAYVVFIDPSAGLTIGGDAPTAVDSTTASAGGEMIQVREGVEIPALRADSVAELVAAAAGVIAYNDNRFREAIELFEQAVPRDRDAPNYGVINFYLGDALRFDDQVDPANAAFERTIDFYETRRAAALPLTARDSLLLARAYLQRGWLALDGETPEAAVAWFSGAVPIYDAVMAGAASLDRPVDARAVYARLFGQLAVAERRLGHEEAERDWIARADAELDALAAAAAPDDVAAFAQESVARFFIGDCTGSIAALERVVAIDPANIDALNAIGITTMFQGRDDLAAAAYDRVFATRPNDAIALQNLALLVSGPAYLAGHYVEPAYLVESEAWFRRILAVDPANANAHLWLAQQAEIRGGFAMFDATASEQGDHVALAKSQEFWPSDLQRRAAAIAAWDIVIEERRILATEIFIDDPAATVEVARAYAKRQAVYYHALRPLIATDPPPIDEFLDEGAALLADGESIREWAGKVLTADSGASRLDQLNAWAALIDSAAREWSWAIARGDYAGAEAIVEERQRLLAEALALAEAEPQSSVDEAMPLRTIYLEAALLAYFAGDAEGYAAYLEKAYAISSTELDERRESNRFGDTMCREERERDAGDAALAAGDHEEARRRYEAALALNPNHVPALTGLTTVLAAADDAPGALDAASRAAAVLPDDPLVRLAMIRARLAGGDQPAFLDAVNQFLAATAALPPQHRMSLVRDLGIAVDALVAGRPERAPFALAAVAAVAANLATMPAEYGRTSQYPSLYLQYGRLALYAGDPAAAETLIRQAIALDSRQPVALVALALTAVARGADGGAELDAALAESRDPFWSWNVNDPDEMHRLIFPLMLDEIAAFQTRVPGHEATLEPLTAAVEAELAALPPAP